MAIDSWRCHRQQEHHRILRQRAVGFSQHQFWTPLAMAAVAANIEVIRDEKIVEHVAGLGSYFGAQLDELVARHPCAASVSGRGFAWAIELVKNPTTGEKWVPHDRWYTPGIDPDFDFKPGQFVADECVITESSTSGGNPFINTPTDTRSDNRRSDSGFLQPERGMSTNYMVVTLIERYWI